MPRVSVIIPTFNRANYVCEAINSVLSQTSNNYEIIVVDDGSTDNTKQVLKKYGDKIKYLSQANQGPAIARNFGISNSTGEFIGLLDDDDLWMPNKLDIQVDVLEKNSELAFVCSGSYVIDETGKIIDHWRMRIDETFETLYEEPCVLNLTVLMRRCCYENVGRYDTTLFGTDDYDMWLRLARRYKFQHIDMPLTKYRLHKNNLSAQFEKRIRNHIVIIRKKELSAHLSLIGKQIRIAKEYYYWANLYEHGNKFYPGNQYKKAARLYLKSIISYPFIGIFYWPQETKKIRFSFPYRIFKIYYLFAICLLKSFKK